MAFPSKVAAFDKSIPTGQFLTAVLVTVGVALILVGVYCKSNVVKSGVAAWAIMP